MWTQKNRPRYDRDHLRYPSDLTDEEWAVVEPLIPPPRPGGGKRRCALSVTDELARWRDCPNSRQLRDIEALDTVAHERRFSVNPISSILASSPIITSTSWSSTGSSRKASRTHNARPAPPRR